MNNTESSEMRKDIALYATQLQKFIDKKGLCVAYQNPRRSDRLFLYSDIIQDACYACFRVKDNQLSDTKKPIVYGFNGQIWVPLLPVVFENAVRDALVKSAGSGDFVVRGDWVEKQDRILKSAYEGASVSSLGSNPAIVGFVNGVFDFSDIRHPVKHKFSDKLPVTDLLPYEFNANAQCPLWRKFLKMMLSEADIAVLQKYLGLGVVNRRMLDRRIEETLWMVGSGANGKSTIQKVVRACYGYDNISETSLAQLLDKNPDARMRATLSIEGKIFNLCDEVDSQDITSGSDTFKKLCSGEPQNVRSIGKDIRVAHDIPFLIFSMNQIPANKRMDAAFKRRLLRIDFRRSIKQEDMDPNLFEKLCGELSGIRNWMIEGYLKLSRDDFKFKHTADDVLAEANEQFFDIFARLEGFRASAWAGHDERPQLVQAATLYNKYLEFCDRNMYGVPSMRQMGLDCRRLQFMTQRRAAGVFYEIYCDRKLEYAVQM